MFLDSCLLVRLSKRGTMGPLVSLATLGGIQFVTSKYAMDEMFKTMMDPAWPPKAAIATIVTVGYLVTLDCLHFVLDDMPRARIDAAIAAGLCDDIADVPIILAAEQASCDYLLTTDIKILESRVTVRCLRPEDLIAEVKQAVLTLAQSLDVAAATQEQAVAPEGDEVFEPGPPKPSPDDEKGAP